MTWEPQSPPTKWGWRIEIQEIMQYNITDSLSISISTMDFSLIANIRAYTIMYSIFLFRRVIWLTNISHVKAICFLGSKHIYPIFGLPFEKKCMSPYQISELSMAKFQWYPENLNILRILYLLLFEEIGKLPAEMPSVIEIILWRLINNDVFMGGVIIIITMDHTKTQLSQAEQRNIYILQ